MKYFFNSLVVLHDLSREACISERRIFCQIQVAYLTCMRAETKFEIFIFSDLKTNLGVVYMGGGVRQCLPERGR